jgi:hypothetical protein
VVDDCLVVDGTNVGDRSSVLFVTVAKREVEVLDMIVFASKFVLDLVLKEFDCIGANA